MSTDIQTVEVSKEITTATDDIEAWAAGVVIDSGENRKEALAACKRIKSRKAEVVAFFRETKDKAHKTWKAIVAQEKSFTDRMDAAEKAIKAAVVAYDTEQEKIRAAEQARLQAEADAAAERERIRLEKEAAKLKTPELKEQRMEQAAAVVAPVVQVAPAAEKVEGVSTRSTWKAEVVDLALLPKEWMTPNQQALDSHARSTKGGIAIPGVKFVEIKSMAVR